MTITITPEQHQAKRQAKPTPKVQRLGQNRPHLPAPHRCGSSLFNTYTAWKITCERQATPAAAQCDCVRTQRVEGPL